MKIAFFDFDGTITRNDTFISFAGFSVGKKRFFIALLKTLPFLIFWKTGFMKSGKAKEKLFRNLYKGMKYERFKQLGKEFVKEVDINVLPDAKAKIQWHLSNDCKVAIVSASIREWIEPWAKQNGVDEVIATKVEVDEKGCLTGRFSTNNCHGEEKAKRIRDIFPQIDEAETWGYGDSAGDYAMLKLVNHPYLNMSPFLIKKAGKAEKISPEAGSIIKQS